MNATEWLVICMRMVEWGSTLFEKFTLQRKNGGTYENIVPSDVFAVLETYSQTPQTLASLSCRNIGTGTYVVSFYADKATTQTDKLYYITLYWEYLDDKMCERVLVKVVVDR